MSLRWSITDDPVADAEDYYSAMEEEWEEMKASAPLCDDCNRSLAWYGDEFCFQFDDYYICDSCMRKRMKPIPYGVR